MIILRLALRFFILLRFVHYGRSSPLSDGPWGPTNPKANPKAVIMPPNNGQDHVRFTILTERLIRIEQASSSAKPATQDDDSDGIPTFEDRKTVAVINRYFEDVPHFTTQITDDGKLLTIYTDYLQLVYKIGQPLESQGSLEVTGTMGRKLDPSAKPKDNDDRNNQIWKWEYDATSSNVTCPEGNLLGTIRTLDRNNIVSLNCSDQPTNAHCEPGLISREGYAIVDDSENWAITSDDEDWWDSPNRNQVDLYLFGHGHNYKQALADYVKIGGRIPMLPRYAWGVWFSRWYDYNPKSIQKLIETYETHTLPLDVFVLDMNWHTKNDWTGYSFDSHLFGSSPPEDMLSYLKYKNLAVTMNLHDADGINKWETQFEPMCQLMGCNSSLDKPINFTITNQTFMLGLEDIVLKPLEDVNGVDFWWIDWQQGESKYGGNNNKKNPTIWTSHIRSTDFNRRQTNKRAMVLARWGGLGAHRYPIHFSGDASISWKQLSFQPYFSMTATNVGAIWSHDISAQVADPELFTRWIQWSVFSGVSRVHDKGTSAGSCARKDPGSCTTVEPWKAPPRYALANYEALRWRDALIPYIYTASYNAHQNGLWFVRPLYYEYPELDGAYITGSSHPSNTAKFESQYLFGDDLMVIPVVKPVNKTTELATLKVWIPPGTWGGISGGRVLVGDEDEGSPVTVHADINEIPVYAKVGSVVPTIPVRPGNTIGLARKQYDQLIWTVFMACEGTPASGFGYVYEDNAQRTDYLRGHFALTRASYTIKQKKHADSKSETVSILFTVETSGSYSEMPQARSTMVRFINVFPPSQVTVANVTFPYSRFGGSGSWSYDALKGAVLVEVPPKPPKNGIVIELLTLHPINGSVLDGLGFKLCQALSAKESLDQIRITPGSQTGQDKSQASLMQAASAASGLEYFANDASSFLAKLHTFDCLLKDAVDEVKGLLVNSLFAKNGEEATETRFLRYAENGEPNSGVNHVFRALQRLLETQ